MKIIRALPLMAFSLLACGHADRPVCAPLPADGPAAIAIERAAPNYAINPPVSPQVVPEQVFILPPNPTHFADLPSAINSLLNPELKVIALGELHKLDHTNLTSTLSHFAREGLPELAAHGRTNLVIEALPSGQAAHDEILAFNQTGQLGPMLSSWYAFNPDYCGILNVMEQARALGIKLHGAQAQSVTQYIDNSGSIATLINQNALNEIRALVANGELVTVYTGATHNNTFPTPGKAIFGEILRSELGAGYLEVDLYLPELMPASEADQTLFLENWEEYIPINGVNLIRVSDSRTVLVLPRANYPIVEQSPASEPDCD